MSPSIDLPVAHSAQQTGSPEASLTDDRPAAVMDASSPLTPLRRSTRARKPPAVFGSPEPAAAKAKTRRKSSTPVKASAAAGKPGSTLGTPGLATASKSAVTSTKKPKARPSKGSPVPDTKCEPKPVKPAGKLKVAPPSQSTPEPSVPVQTASQPPASVDKGKSTTGQQSSARLPVKQAAKEIELMTSSNITSAGSLPDEKGHCSVDPDQPDINDVSDSVESDIAAIDQVDELESDASVSVKSVFVVAEAITTDAAEGVDQVVATSLDHEQDHLQLASSAASHTFPQDGSSDQHKLELQQASLDSDGVPRGMKSVDAITHVVATSFDHKLDWQLASAPGSIKAPQADGSSNNKALTQLVIDDNNTGDGNGAGSAVQQPVVNSSTSSHDVRCSLRVFRDMTASSEPSICLNPSLSGPYALEDALLDALLDTPAKI
ncbi:hypothetical protein Pst134EA_021139 [Puccinia striiformis f. sp. tritici]|uniref:hypothetical protein n=1 Tax=Puccinia striiformis f. sp. tritici TaxID=168172 RepID=UPI002007B27F|nr:hypothetical protein Pst134EA_021139 [Puccinia striiformis f. sp. tritici]KAH9457254.1 hypothetical protein Pst134EA_021139 [Puccinia striiformis f. sp. tritici]